MRLGKLSDSILKRTVLKHIKKNREEVISGAGIGEDCAILQVREGKLATCVEEYTVADRQDMMRAIYKATNNLAACGAEPIAVMLTIILPERASEEKLRKLMDAASEAAAKLNIQIAGGHTTVSKYVTQKLAVITAYGRPMSTTLLPTKGAEPGQDIVISKWIGLEGTAALAQLKKEELEGRYPEYFVAEAAAFDKYLSVIPEATIALQNGVCVMHDASEGGIMGTLWELAESSGVGLSVDIKRIPIRQETVEVCEFCDVNPYELMSGGCLVMTSKDGDKLAEALQEQGIAAVVAGKIIAGKDRILINGEEKRYLDKPKMDEIHRFI